MWCKHCREDVPGYAVTVGGPVSCARCGTPLLIGQREAPAAEGVKAAAVHGIDLSDSREEPLSEIDEWDLDDELSDSIGLAARPPVQPTWRMDSREFLGPTHASYVAANPLHSRHEAAASRKRRTSVLAWVVLSLSLMSFVCGAVLLGWAMLSGRGELWNLGLPICIGGQIGLIVGLVLQLERVWQSSHQAADKLEHLDEQLHEIKRSNALLHTTTGSAAQAFYAHMAEGASPQLLLADLKGQLDLLAIRMAEQNSGR